MDLGLVSTFLALGLAMMGLTFISIFLSLNLVIRCFNLVLIITLGLATISLFPLLASGSAFVYVFGSAVVN